jgi:hypothetical protein
VGRQGVKWGGRSAFQVFAFRVRVPRCRVSRSCSTLSRFTFAFHVVAFRVRVPRCRVSRSRSTLSRFTVVFHVVAFHGRVPRCRVSRSCSTLSRFTVAFRVSRSAFARSNLEPAPIGLEEPETWNANAEGETRNAERETRNAKRAPFDSRSPDWYLLEDASGSRVRMLSALQGPAQDPSAHTRMK